MNSAISGNKRQRDRTEHVNVQSDAQAFSIALLREALDAERRRRQLSWAAATRQINRE
eukprot:SAG11_NODE_15961_length_561_cov_0.982684_2_plen_57_part_01